MVSQDMMKNVPIPEDSTSHKAAVKFVFDPETKEFYPDSGGLYSTEPQTHRTTVTGVDTEDPNLDQGIECKGFARCRFDLDVLGDNINSLKVEVLRWNGKAEKWFHNGNLLELMNADNFSSYGGNISLLEDEAFGAKIFLRVAEFTGGGFIMDAYYALC